jgi:signal transduction histidine kinase
VTEPAAGDRSLADSPWGASETGARPLLEHAVARIISVLAHDMRNSIGVVAMQVEAIAMRARAAVVEGDAIGTHADAAGDQIERLADMMNALIAFARGRASSDLSVIFGEVVHLAPLRPILVVRPDMATVCVDPILVRAIALEVLASALSAASAPTFTIEERGEHGARLYVTSGQPMEVDDTVEWVVQFKSVGGSITATDDGLMLEFPKTV